MANNKNLPPPAQFVDPATGRLTRQANNFLNAITSSSNVAASGDIATPADSGLEGGGTVADGVTLSIAPNGVTDQMLRQSVATSVIGRLQNSAGNVSDIPAVQNRTVLQRIGDQLSFFPALDVPSVTCDTLTILDNPVGSVATTTHVIALETAAGTFYLLLSDVI